MQFIVCKCVIRIQVVKWPEKVLSMKLSDTDQRTKNIRNTSVLCKPNSWRTLSASVLLGAFMASIYTCCICAVVRGSKVPSILWSSLWCTRHFGQGKFEKAARIAVIEQPSSPSRDENGIPGYKTLMQSSQHVFASPECKRSRIGPKMTSITLWYTSLLKQAHSTASELFLSEGSKGSSIYKVAESQN